MDFKYDKEIEITKSQYEVAIVRFKGSIAHRIENGKYFIKVWLMGCCKGLKSLLSKS